MSTKKSGNKLPTARTAQHNAKDHFVNFMKAALATTPFAGGIATLIDDYIPSTKQKRLEQFVKQLGQDLDALRDRISEDAFLNEEFSFAFEKCFRGVAENYQKEKLEAYRGILLNSAIGSNVEADEAEYYISLVDRLSALHLRILGFMANPDDFLTARGIPKEQITGGFANFFPVAIPGVGLEAIKSAFGDLHQLGLISTDKSIFHTTTAGQGLDLLGNRVSNAGQDFIRFCTTPD